MRRLCCLYGHFVCVCAMDIKTQSHFISHTYDSLFRCVYSQKQQLHSCCFCVLFCLVQFVCLFISSFFFSSFAIHIFILVLLPFSQQTRAATNTRSSILFVRLLVCLLIQALFINIYLCTPHCTLYIQQYMVLNFACTHALSVMIQLILYFVFLLDELFGKIRFFFLLHRNTN